jgi:hypothetical protein
MKNNTSRSICSTIAHQNGWTKETHRNVILINGKKWSFSVSSFNPECRQVYEDTEGFITLTSSGVLKKYKIKDFSKLTVSRISPTGVKAYSVRLKNDSELQPLF